MRLRIPLSNDKEWVSVIPEPGCDQVVVVRQSGEELRLGIDAEEPLEPQIAAQLEALDLTT